MEPLEVVAQRRAKEFFDKIMDQGEDPLIAENMLTGTIICPKCNQGTLYIRKIKEGTSGKCNCGIEWNDYDSPDGENPHQENH